MSDHEITRYLAAALDQVACKDTLRAALRSRVDALSARGITQPTLIGNLRRMCADVYQLNDDVILEVIEQF